MKKYVKPAITVEIIETAIPFADSGLATSFNDPEEGDGDDAAVKMEEELEEEIFIHESEHEFVWGEINW